MMAEQEILVSIVVAVYNGASTLPRCLDSLVNQTWKNIEIICVNDCSKDNSEEILVGYQKNYPQIRIINHEENKHGGGADNTGIKAALGTYVCIVDQDDWLELDSIERLLKNALNGNIDIVLGGQWREIASDGTITYHDNMIIGGSLEENIRCAFLNGCRILGGLFKKSLFVNNNLWYPEKVNWADNALFDALILASRSIVVSDYCIYDYYVVSNSSSRTISVKSIEDRIYTTKLCLSNCMKVDNDGKYLDEIKYRFLSLTRTTLYALTDFDNIPFSPHLIDEFKNDISFCIDCSYFKLFTKEEQTSLLTPKGYLTKQYILYLTEKIKRIPHQIRHKIVVLIKKCLGMDPAKSIYNRD